MDVEPNTSSLDVWLSRLNLRRHAAALGHVRTLAHVSEHSLRHLPVGPRRKLLAAAAAASSRTAATNSASPYQEYTELQGPTQRPSSIIPPASYTTNTRGTSNATGPTLPAAEAPPAPSVWQLARTAAAAREMEEEEGTCVQVYVEQGEDAEAAVTAALQSGVSPRRLAVVRSDAMQPPPAPQASASVSASTTATATQQQQPPGDAGLLEVSSLETVWRARPATAALALPYGNSSDRALWTAVHTATTPTLHTAISHRVPRDDGACTCPPPKRDFHVEPCHAH